MATSLINFLKPLGNLRLLLKIWNALEDNYLKDNDGALKFTASNFNNFKIVDNIPINDQIHKFQSLIQEIHMNDSKFAKSYLVSCLIDKSPPS